MTLSDRLPLSGPAARSVAQDQTVVCLTPASDQCDINVGLVIEACIPRVVPPRINSRSRGALVWQAAELAPSIAEGSIRGMSGHRTLRVPRPPRPKAYLLTFRACPRAA